MVTEYKRGRLGKDTLKFNRHWSELLLLNMFIFLLLKNSFNEQQGNSLKYQLLNICYHECFLLCLFDNKKKFDYSFHKFS